jgi:tetratricopeptide (TPR) repeat protein
MDEQSLFEAALQLPVDRRLAFLAEACVGNVLLRERVERLLAADEHKHGILERGPVTIPAVHQGLFAGMVLADRYRLTRKLGEGGMGEVWAADQIQPVPRPVAIKFLLDSYNPHSATSRRFVAEARIMASLQHPGIPPVHHVDVMPDDRPYMVMKLIAGQTLETLLREQGPSPTRWIGIFEAICQALGYAHASGVIHRDLKPSNVMVGAFGEVQVMDWGIAKLLQAGAHETAASSEVEAVPPERASASADVTRVLTKTGAMMGTPAYMAPEQAAGKWDAVDCRSDVFGLGAILHALLTGSAPATKALRSGQLGNKSPGDTFARLDDTVASPELVALCKRCLACEPEDRPADGAAVAAEVAELRRAAEERARQAEVDRAKAEVHAAEQRKRRRLTLLGSAALMLVLLAGIAGTAIGLVRAERARANESQQRTTAEAARDHVRDVLDAMTSQVAGDFLTTQQVLGEEQKRFLTEVLTYYKQFAGEQANDEASRKRIASAAVRVGEIEDRLGRREEAATAFRAALQMYEILASEDPTSVQYRRDQADCHNNLGNGFTELRRNDEAEWHFRQALAIREKLVAEEPLSAAYRRELGTTHHNLGILLLGDFGRKPAAQEQFQLAFAIREKLVAEEPHSGVYQRELAATLSTLGRVLWELGQNTDAERYCKKALPLLERLVFVFPTSLAVRRELAVTLNNQGNVLYEYKKWPAAEEYYSRALVLRERLAAEYPGSADIRHELAITLTNLGNLYCQMEKRTTSEEHIHRSVALLEKLKADFPNIPAYQSELGNAYLSFGILVFVRGEAGESVQWFDKGINTLTPIHEKYPDDAQSKRFLRNNHRGRAVASDRLERFGEAVKDWDRAVELSQPEERPQLRATRTYSLMRSGQVARSLAEAGELRQLDVWTAAELYDLACVYSLASARIPEQKQEHGDRAMELLRRAVSVGWKDVKLTKEDTDLDPLRARDDFKKWLVDLEKKYPPDGSGMGKGQ